MASHRMLHHVLHQSLMKFKGGRNSPETHQHINRYSPRSGRLFIYLIFEIGFHVNQAIPQTHYITEDDLELMIFPPLPPMCQEYMHGPYACTTTQLAQVINIFSLTFSQLSYFGYYTNIWQSYLACKSCFSCLFLSDPGLQVCIITPSSESRICPQGYED